MPLTLLTGPAGSGKTGEVLERFTGSLEREPVLVVPTGTDVERFEDELLARRPVALGGRIVTFDRLVDLVRAAAGEVGRPPLTDAQRRALLARVTEECPLQALREPAARPGFLDALDAFVTEAQAAVVSPADLVARLGRSEASSGQAREAATLYRDYVDRRDALGRSDRGGLLAAAVAAVRRDPSSGAGRPILLHGFDDLTPAQLGLLGALASSAEVLVSVVHEAGRTCLAARTRLVERIQALGVTDRLDLPPRTSDGPLSHLERAFLTDAPPRREPGTAVRLLDAAGVRSEVEQVAAAVAQLLRDGAAPDEVAVVARSPHAEAGLVEEVFEAFGIPVAIHAERTFEATATGRALIALLRAAFVTRSATDLVSFLRATGASSARVDRLERAVRVERLDTVDEALTRWEALDGRRPWELQALTEAAAAGGGRLLERTATLARHIAQRPHRRSAPALDAPRRAEQAAAEAAAGALEEIAELVAVDPSLAPTPDALLQALRELRLRRALGGVAGRVEVMSPYRARARQFPYVFVLSLQEGEFPRRGREDPFLTERERRAAGLPERADPRDEERYLFYVCLTRATRRLHLSYRSTDDEGQAQNRSFLVDEVLDLLTEGAEHRITTRKDLSATVLAAVEAPTEDELARSLAADRLVETPDALEASPALAARLCGRLIRARARAEHLPGPLRTPAALELLGGTELIGASTLESYAECPFRWLVGHELRPRELAADPEPLARGAITHRVLERLYEERLREGLDARPTPDTLEDVVARACEILAEEAERTSLSPTRAAARPAYRRIEADIARLLRYDADHGAGARTAFVEASFGAGEEDARGPLPLDGFGLHGKIDRIDVTGAGQALIRDYKTGARVTPRKKLSEEGKLQLPLYMLAARELWGLEPIGAVYHPLGEQKAHVPRGLLRGPRDRFPVDEPFVGRDFTADADEFAEHLDAARAEAERIGGRIRAGHLARDPLGGSCPRHCDFHPICRRERGEKNPEVMEQRPEEEDDD